MIFLIFVVVVVGKLYYILSCLFVYLFVFLLVLVLLLSYLSVLLGIVVYTADIFIASTAIQLRYFFSFVKNILCGDERVVLI